MKTLIIFILCVYSTSTLAQQKLDTIYANDQKNVALFFPDPVRQGITGAAHFVFTYNREKEQYFGLIQAKPGKESNLLVITGDGKVYSYILKHNDSLPKLNYFIAESESIGNEAPSIVDATPNMDPVSKTEKRLLYFENFSRYLLKLRPENLRVKRKKGLKVQLQRIVHQNSEVYLVIEVTNNSEVDFEIDYLNVYRVNGNKKRKASYQRLQQEVIYRYKMPKAIAVGDTQKFVCVLSKFVLGDGEKLMLELNELKGNRKVILETGLY